MRKAVSILLAISLSLCSVFIFSGCAKNVSGDYKLVFITDGAPINDNGVNQSTWNGVSSYAEENGISCRYYQPGLTDGELTKETAANYIDLAVKNGAQTVVLSGEAFSVSAFEIAPTYKDVNFVLVDAVPHSEDDDAMRMQNNVMIVSFNKLEAGFLAGYSAVADGYTKLGYLGSFYSQDSSDYGAGFSQGAAYAADSLGIPVYLDYAQYDNPFINYDYSFTIEPQYIPVEEANEQTFKVTVVDGVGTGVYTDGENVTITANPAPEGKIFDHWEVKSDTEGVKDKKVNISHKNRASMNLLVGDCDCTITAVWADADTVPVTVTESDGVTPHETINAPVNSSVWVSAPAAQPGFVFDHWETASEDAVEDLNGKGTNVKVEDSAVTLKPVYTISENPTFDITVKNGTGTGSYVTDDEVNLVADPPEEGMMFYKWNNVDSQGLSTGIAMDNEYCYHTSFKMVDRYASVAEKMYDDGTQVIFGGGNPLSDSIFTATWEFDYPVYAFGSGIDEGSKGNCLASVVTDFGAAVKLALEDYKGGAIFTGNCENNCLYVTGKSLDETYTDKKGNEVENPEYNEGYAAVYEAIAKKEIKPINVQVGADFRKAINSKCLTVNYWVL